MFLSAPAYSLTGDELAKLCKGDQVFTDIPRAESLQVCQFYIRGILDHAEVHGELKPEFRLFCIPDSMRLDDIRSTFVSWAEDKVLTGESSGRSIVGALLESFPCAG